MLKRFVSRVIFCTMIGLFLSSCSTLDRMQRLDATHALQRVNYLNPDAVNLWPLFFTSADYVSIIWPLADWDRYGFAIRPLINKEKDDWSFLFPLSGWDSGNGNGWCAIGYWFPSREKYGVFPLFHYNGHSRFFYVGPVWKDCDSYGFFPLAWVGDRESLVFPLLYADRDRVLSLPFCYAKMPENEEGRWEHPTDSPKGFAGLRRINDWRWYYTLLWYSGHNDCTLIDEKNPAMEYATAEISNAARNLYMRDKGVNVSHQEAQKYVREKQVAGEYEAKEVWYGLFPFFHYETFYDLKKGPDKNDPYYFNALCGLAGLVRRTPTKDVTSVFGPLGYLRRTDRFGGKHEVETETDDLTWSALLYYAKHESFWRMTPAATFRFQRVSREDLEHRLSLYLEEDIQRWEERFAWNQAYVMEHYRQSWVPVGTYSRPLFRTNMIPTPKTRQEVEALLAEVNAPQNHTHVQERSFGVLPFYQDKTLTQGEDVSTDTRTLLGLLSCSKMSKYSSFRHLLGPLAYLHSERRTEGEYEHEKSRDEFSMSLLAYWLSKDRWEMKQTAIQRYKGVMEEKLYRRIGLTDPKEIAQWERNFAYTLDADSELEAPKSAQAARDLLAEINATHNYVKNHESGYGLAPFFSHREHRHLTDTGVFLDALFRYKRSPARDITHLLGPLGFYQSRTSNEPDYACQKAEDKFFVSMLYYKGSSEWKAFTPEAQKQFAAVSPDSLHKRLTMVNPKDIAQWESGRNAEYWFDDPHTPHQAPASAAEAKVLYKAYYDIANYRSLRRDYWGVLPFFHRETALDETRFNVLGGILSAGEKSPQRDAFHILGRLGYKHDKKSSAPDATPETRAVDESTSLLLCYSETKECDLRTAEASSKYSDVPAHFLPERIRMGDGVDAETLARWEDNFEVASWRMDPRSTRTAPKSLDAAKSLYLDYHAPTNYTRHITQARGVFPFVHHSHSDTSSGFKLLMGLLTDWREVQTPGRKFFFFHLLGPIFYRDTMSQQGPLESEKQDKRFTLAALLAYHKYELRQARTEASEAQINVLHHYQIDQMVESYDPVKVDALMQDNTRLDGTTAFPKPENSADAKKLWLDANAAGTYEANPYEAFGVAPLFHFGSDALGRERNLYLPPLLSWHTATPGLAKTYLLAGLLYYRSDRSRKDPLQAKWVADLPYSHQIYTHEKPFIEGDEDFEASSFQGSSSRICLIAGNNRGKVLFWKKGSPSSNLSHLYYDLTCQPEKVDLEFMKELGLDTSKATTWIGCAQLRKQILDTWVEVRDISERGRLGRLLYRYGRCGDDAAFWLGGGMLAKYTQQDGAEDVSVLGFLYRSHKDATSSSRMIFPFIASNEDESGSQFSFLWRLVDVKRSKSGDLSGHLFFIPF